MHFSDKMMEEFVVHGKVIYKIATYNIQILTLNRCLYRGYIYENNKLLYVTSTYVTQEEATQIVFDKVKSFISLKGIFSAL